MYIKRESKYFIYLFILDIFAVAFSFFLAISAKFHLLVFFDEIPKKYMLLLAIAILAMLFTNEQGKNYDDFFNRGYLIEFCKVASSTFFTVLITILFLFFTKNSESYSRMFIFLYIIFAIAFSYIFRTIFKAWVRKKHRNSSNGSKVMVISVGSKLDDLQTHSQNQNSWDYGFSFIAVIDKDMRGSFIGKTEIKGTYENMYEYAKTNVVDEVLINIGYHHEKLKEIIQTFEAMGITCHIVLNNLSFEMANPRIENFAGYNVVTTSNNAITHFELIEKRVLDILGATIGLIITGLVSIFVVPLIKKESPGPAIYSQTRIGRNGRKFKIYKFRSMYMDADKRKQELMEQNKMDGFMFKVDDDPRITKIGKLIRKTSIDELPQFWNVFKGEMSLVGTRPPTEDEFIQYEFHHKNRLSFKPGLTGMWQATGRSDITDFEEVVKLDTKYIESWSIMLDIKIIIQTVISVLKRKGSE